MKKFAKLNIEELKMKCVYKTKQNKFCVYATIKTQGWWSIRKF